MSVPPDLPEVADISHTTDYPENWLQLATAMKNWAGWHCEVCGHINEWESGHVLTIHHLDKNTHNNHWTNLLVCCQRCHLHIQGTWRPGQPWLFDPPYWWQIRFGGLE